jgi:hypothetical protein
LENIALRRLETRHNSGAKEPIQAQKKQFRCKRNNSGAKETIQVQKKAFFVKTTLGKMYVPM